MHLNTPGAGNVAPIDAASDTAGFGTDEYQFGTATPKPTGDELPPGFVVQDFPIIALGHGHVLVCEGMHEGLPALAFLRGGKGFDAPFEQIKREAKNGETLALFTFCDQRAIDAIETALRHIRTKFTGFDPNGEG